MTIPRIRPLHSNDFETLVLLEREIEAQEGASACRGPTSSTYYLRLCCEYFQQTSFLMEVEGEAVGYLLAFVQGRDAFCTAFGVRQELDGENARMELVQTWMAHMGARVEALWFTLPPQATSKRHLLQCLGGVEVEHRADVEACAGGRVLVRLGQSIRYSTADAQALGAGSAAR